MHRFFFNPIMSTSLSTKTQRERIYKFFTSQLLYSTMTTSNKRQKVERGNSDVPPKSSSNAKKNVATLPHFSNSYYPQTASQRKLTKSFLPQLNELCESSGSSEVSPDILANTKCVVHLFSRDFRLDDNVSLYEASQFATKHNLPLVCLHIDLPDFDRAHSMSGWQKEYRRESLREIQQRLKKENVPLIFSSCNSTDRSEILKHLVECLNEIKSTVLYSNILYEVDEIRLCIDYLKKLPKLGIHFTPMHNLCVVNPSSITTQKGSPYSIFTPWFRTWLNYFEKEKKNILKVKTFTSPNKELKNDEYIRSLFESPSSTIEYDYKDEDQSEYGERYQRENFKNYWEAGELAALKQLDNFIDSKLLLSYEKSRGEGVEPIRSSQLSAHISSGTLSVRTILRKLAFKFKINDFSKYSKESGVSSWIRQLAWKDFYCHILCHWPYICTFRPFQTDFAELQWEYNKDHFEAWCQGKTGYPFVDAAMRQLNQTGYMHNRSRMVVASFLAKHLFIDWRYGERYFTEHLVDFDFASNNGGWGFSSSVGVDPQPYFRIFNPWTQSTKFDADGTFIKKWIPELQNLDAKSIHKPHEAKEEIGSYPKPIVEHTESRERALERYKEAKYP